MFTFLFLLLLVFFLWPIFGLALKLFRLKRSVRRAWEGAGQAASGRPEGFSADSRQKVYGSSVGEYVDFEEVPDAEPSRQSVSSQAADDDDFVPESQVVDAEFEEIP